MVLAALLGLVGLRAVSQHYFPLHAAAVPQAQPTPSPTAKPATPAASPHPNAQKPARQTGDWLLRHKDLPPDQQEKLLENDPYFKKLTPQRQAELRERLRKFNSLPPAERERAVRRMQYMASLTQDQRKQIRDANQELQKLPKDRQVMVHKALRHLRTMDKQGREQVYNSDQFKTTFSDQEQTILKDLSEIRPPEPPHAPAPSPSGEQPR